MLSQAPRNRAEGLAEQAGQLAQVAHQLHADGRSELIRTGVAFQSARLLGRRPAQRLCQLDFDSQRRGPVLLSHPFTELGLGPPVVGGDAGGQSSGSTAESERMLRSAAQKAGDNRANDDCLQGPLKHNSKSALGATKGVLGASMAQIRSLCIVLLQEL